MHITLRNLKIDDAASEETLSFTASVYINGKRAGTAANEGRGGANTYYPHALAEALRAHAATLPARRLVFGGGHIITAQPDADWVIGDLVDEYLQLHQAAH